jgi:hypothetical protein
MDEDLLAVLTGKNFRQMARWEHEVRPAFGCFVRVRVTLR